MKNSKRIKRVFSNAAQVLHLWANQSQSDARSKNVFFDGKACYSYGRHYMLGRLVSYRGVTVALINDSGYSNTTAKHIHWAFGAVSHLPRLKSTDLNDVKSALLRAQGELVDELFNFFNTRRSYYFESFNDNSWLLERINEFNKTARALKHSELVLDINETYKNLYLEHILFCRQKRDADKTPEAVAKKQIEREKRLAAEVKKQETLINQWRTGTGALPSMVRQLRFQLLRVRGENVDTSKGATVPLEHAVRLLNLIEKKKVKNGERVGLFTVSSLNTEFIQIGCHNIQLSEARAVLSPYMNKLTLVKNENENENETLNA